MTGGAKERLAGKDRLMVLQALMKCADISNPVSVFFFFSCWHCFRVRSRPVVDLLSFFFRLLLSFYRLDRWKSQSTGPLLCSTNGITKRHLKSDLLFPSRSSSMPTLGFKRRVRSLFKISSLLLFSMLRPWSCQVRLFFRSSLFRESTLATSSQKLTPSLHRSPFPLPELAPFAEQCSSNRALWFERLSKLTAPDATSKPRSRLSPTQAPPPPLPSHHPDEAEDDVPAPYFPIPCPLNSRYRSLFPLALPPALIALPPPPSPCAPPSSHTARHDASLGVETINGNGKSLGGVQHHEHQPRTSLERAEGGEAGLKVACKRF